MAEGKRPDNAQQAIKNVLTEAESRMKSELSKKTIAEILLEMNN